MGVFHKALGDAMEIRLRPCLVKSMGGDGAHFTEELCDWVKSYEGVAVKLQSRSGDWRAVNRFKDEALRGCLGMGPCLTTVMQQRGYDLRTALPAAQEKRRLDDIDAIYAEFARRTMWGLIRSIALQRLICSRGCWDWLVESSVHGWIAVNQ
jgi:hypothetical protein